jgi:hypothetical protein
MSDKKKRIAVIVYCICFFSILSFILINSSSIKRSIVDFKSDIDGGLERTINVYTANGDLMATYTGKIDLDMNVGGYVKFDFEGKRYIYYNCFVESIAEY